MLIEALLRRLRAPLPDGKLVLIWDGAPYHRATAVRAAAADLGSGLAPLPGYSPDLTGCGKVTICVL